ncbi:hypothetical protein JCM11251_000849 [Rhodosporidiobolus azoricus]
MPSVILDYLSPEQPQAAPLKSTVVPHLASDPTSTLPSSDKENRPKRVGIIGAGTGGVGALLALLDLPESTRRGWTIEVLEKRGDVGGIWLPDEHDHSASSGTVPETPLYPALRTNTAIPTMTFTSHPFPPNTPLFPSHTHIHAYHRNVISDSNLSHYLHFNRAVEHASWEEGRWVVQVAHLDGEGGGEGEKGKWVEVKEYDHIVVATGRYHQPSIPHWPGEEEWVAAASSEGEREIVHSLWYRGPEKYQGKTVVVVGFGASGWDIATQVETQAEVTYHSYTPHPESPVQLPPVPGTIYKSRISHFTPTAIHFTDGSSVSTVDKKTSIVLATGYILSIPFLSPHLLSQAPLPLPPATPPANLTTNGAYLRALYRDVLVLDPRLPPNALGLIGLPWFIAAAQASYIQGLLCAHAFANEDHGRLLPGGTRQGALRELEEEEERRRKDGEGEPFIEGHKFSRAGAAEAYQDSLLSLLHSRSSVPLPPMFSNPSTPYVPEWRRWGRAQTINLRRAFLRAVQEGVEEQLFRAKGKYGLGVEEMEREWVEVMHALSEWEEKRKEEDEREGGREKVRFGEEREGRPLVVLEEGAGAVEVN